MQQKDRENSNYSLVTKTLDPHNIKLDRPETHSPLELVALPEFNEGSQKATIPRSPLGSSGFYKITFVLGIPGVQSFHENLDFSQLMTSGDSLLSLPQGLSLEVHLTKEPIPSFSGPSFLLLTNHKGNLSHAEIRLHATDRRDATRQAFKIFMPFISWCSYEYDVAIAISGYEVLEENTEIQGWTFNIVGQSKLLNLPDEQTFLTKSTPELRALFAIYREALSATNVFYQILCFHRVIEGVKKLRNKRLQELKKRGQPLRVPEECIPENENDLGISDVEARNSFKAHLGKKFTYVLEKYRRILRNAIAHLDPTTDVLSPDDFDDLRICEAALPVLKYIGRVMLRNEIQTAM